MTADAIPQAPRLMSANAILLRRYDRVYLSESPPGSSSPPEMVAALNQNLQGLGYTLEASTLDACHRLDPEALQRFHDELIRTLSELRGVRDYKPMYPNFPEQVAEASDAELYFNALQHYFSFWVSDMAEGIWIKPEELADGGVEHRRHSIWFPFYRKAAREKLNEPIFLTVIRQGTLEDLRIVARQLATTNTSLSPDDEADLRWLIAAGYLALPEAIPHRETRALIASLFLDDPAMPALITSATDVLRLAVALSGGDRSLGEKPRFLSFPRKTRKLLLGLLEACDSATRLEDMHRWKGYWIRLGEQLHPGQYRAKYPQSAAAFDILRNDLPVERFNAKVEVAVAGGDIDGIVALMSQRPGVYARSLDRLLRHTPEENRQAIIDGFERVASRVSTPVLLQVEAHFRSRAAAGSTQSPPRLVFPKGALAKYQVIEGNASLPLLWPTAIRSICNRTLVERFKQLPPLGTVYIDPLLETCLVPFSQRSASSGLRTLVRGSQLPIEGTGSTIRFFIWWKEGPKTGRVDLDLSAVLYGREFGVVQHIAYYNLRFGKAKGFHSGDVTSAPDGACEFIDLDLDGILEGNGRYIVMTVHAFTRRPFSALPECMAGWMLRQAPQSGEVFEPAKVADRITIASPSLQVIPLIIDCAERRIIWVDMNLTANRRAVVNAFANQDQIGLALRAFSKVSRADLAHLFRLHAEARGTLVDSPEQADKVFSVANGTHLDHATIMADYLST